MVSTSFVDRQADRQTDGQTPAPYHNTSRQVGRIIKMGNVPKIDGLVFLVSPFNSEVTFNGHGLGPDSFVNKKLQTNM